MSQSRQRLLLTPGGDPEHVPGDRAPCWLGGYDPRAGGRHVRLDDGQGGIDDPRGQTLFQGQFSRRSAARSPFPSGTTRLGRASAATVGRPACSTRSGPCTAIPATARNWRSARSARWFESDQADGFSETMCQPSSRFEPQSMYDELREIVRQRIVRPDLRELTELLLEENQVKLLCLPCGPAAPSCLRSRIPGARVERDADGGLPGRQVCRLLSRFPPAAGQRAGRGGGRAARHRQAPRAGPAAGRHLLHPRGRADRARAPGPRHGARSGPAGGRRRPDAAPPGARRGLPSATAGVGAPPSRR